MTATWAADPAARAERMARLRSRRAGLIPPRRDVRPRLLVVPDPEPTKAPPPTQAPIEPDIADEANAPVEELVTGFGELAIRAAERSRRSIILGPHDAAVPQPVLPSAFILDPDYERYVRARGPGVLEEWALREALGLPPIGVDERPFRTVLADTWGLS